MMGTWMNASGIVVLMIFWDVKIEVIEKNVIILQ